jgi:hypothetical protein
MDKEGKGIIALNHTTMIMNVCILSLSVSGVLQWDTPNGEVPSCWAYPMAGEPLLKTPQGVSSGTDSGEGRSLFSFPHIPFLASLGPGPKQLLGPWSGTSVRRRIKQVNIPAMMVSTTVYIFNSNSSVDQRHSISEGMCIGNLHTQCLSPLFTKYTQKIIESPTPGHLERRISA